ncbi:MAG: Gfo/Idh/MocA family oxidoreductase [Spirochaetales bacterium]
MLKVAIVGLGSIAPIHRHAIDHSKRAKLVCVCDSDSSKKAAYADIAFYTDIDLMLQQEKIDVVHNCLPHYLHHSVTELCAKNGVHVFTEKPVAICYKDAQSLFDLESRYNIKIGVCLQNRYNETSIRAKQLIQSGTYGTLHGAKGIVTWSRTMDYYNESAWRGIMSKSGGGVMINQTIHTIDLLQYIGGSFKNVKSMCANISLPQTQIEDTVVAHFHYQNDATALFFGTIAYADNSSVEMEFILERAKILIRDSKIYLSEDQGDFTLHGEDKKLSGSKHYYGASHMDAIESFYSAILHNTHEYISVKEAATSLKIIEAICTSTETNTTQEIFGENEKSLS